MPLYLSRFDHQPKFHWDQQKLSRSLGALRYRQGRLLGVIEMLGPAARKNALPLHDATEGYDHLLTEERLLSWHGKTWRTARPAIVGAVHTSSPDHPVPSAELRKFLSWFNMDKSTDPVLKAAIAHLWLMVLRPFAEENERIAHLVTDIQLSRADGSAERYYDLSAAMSREAGLYDKHLHKALQGLTEITGWLEWFLDRFDQALTEAEQGFAALKQTRLMEVKRERFPVSLSDRQQLVIFKLLEGRRGVGEGQVAEGIGEAHTIEREEKTTEKHGSISSSQWAAVAGCSQDTALRDILDLVDRGLLMKEPAGGRSTQYRLSMPG